MERTTSFTITGAMARLRKSQAQRGVEKPKWSFPIWFFDYDNDGRLDLFVASYYFASGEWVRPYLGLQRQGDSMKLYRNTGKGTFADVTRETGLDRGVAAMGANFGDVDNDGFPRTSISVPALRLTRL